ncbi:MAG: AmmeMemoRadiSam system protein B [Planctomycetes bacterium]|nr:AmmeMemoRadiSam system protein B [Planctomycetota bacterium]
MSQPKLRPIEAFPVDDRGQRRIVIRDPRHLTDRILAVSPEAFLIVAMLDGENSVRDIQAEILKRFQVMIPSEAIEGLVQTLDEHLFLENERFEAHCRQLVQEFRDAPVRRPCCAGGAYSEDPQELRKEIQAYFKTEEGPGLSDGPSAGKPLKALIAPHIDYQRGGPCYAHVYKKVSEAPPIDVFLILGTGHAGPRGHYVFTRKNFETPLGIVETDQDFINRLEARLGADLCEEEFIHKGEHSIELQLVFLQLTYEPRPCPKIVPILCGGFHEAMSEGKVPSEIPEVRRFLQALRETIAESPLRVCVLASADLSHVGPRFGDEDQVTENFLEWVQREDLEMIEVVRSLQADEFFRQVQKDNDRRRVCGLASIYTLLSVTDAREVELLKYAQAPDPSGLQAVTFCGVAFR